jgi:hypothetical protein
VYSSAGSGIKDLDDARVSRPTAFTLPDRIWIARWDGVSGTSTSYIRNDGWRPHARVKQYQGGHNETWGGVTINIDRNFLDLGRGSVAPAEGTCDGARIPASGFTAFRRLSATNRTVPPPAQVRVVQCLLRQQGAYRGPSNGYFGRRTVAAVNAWQRTHGSTPQPAWTRRDWVTLFAAGLTPVLKYGSTGPAVRRLQRALSAAGTDATAQAVRATGVFDLKTYQALRVWQKRVRVEASGVAAPQTWAALQAGRL